MTGSTAGRALPHAAAGTALALVLLGALCLGTPVLSPHRLPAVLASPETAEYVILWELRLPRLLLGLIAGASLGCAGLLLQEALRNPLAVPDLLGVSSGAVLAVAVAVVFVPVLPLAVLPPLALAGGLAGGGLTLLTARWGRSPAHVLLIGAAVSSALQAGVLTVMAMADQLQLELLYRYLLGSLIARTWDDVTATAPWLLLSVPAVVVCLPLLGVLRLGEDTAGALGLRVRRARVLALATAVVLVAPVVAPCGPVAWVGFLAPHLARWTRPRADARAWLPWSAAWGAVVVLAADLAARLLFVPVEMPLGAWTALVGVLAGVATIRRRPAW
ncbi:iron ABC transporter [Carbonactinospora thermoautotrophica]|uniref:FecCD family ABC transporter permease n=1 Tax=Carbonactinospora thermoautotrophica TaxID=1469144 RepID=UPI002270B709|nr:iron ABC transporter permease [Carbonactinospora thermoautotrophica]MCX9192218.1 iron ABC transporter [Carbonactinospora thermoautotrophica]